MEIGKYYKSIFNDMIVECIYDNNDGTFSGCVIDKGNACIEQVGDCSNEWEKKSFELYNENPTTEQIGGSHYKHLKIQPTEFIHSNNIGFIEGNIIKYVIRHKDKNGLEDLKKAKHYIDLLIKFEYENPKKF